MPLADLRVTLIIRPCGRKVDLPADPQSETAS
jgi:hypothetical protein